MRAYVLGQMTFERSTANVTIECFQILMETG